MKSEVWKPVNANPAYEVSSEGRVRRRVNGHCTFAGRVLKLVLQKGKGKYLAVTLGWRGGRKQYRVNRLVCTAFHGPSPSPDHEAAHLNGRHDDNRADNLAWKTGKENKADELLHGTRTRGERHGQAKLTAECVMSIRLLLGSAQNVEIAKQFGVSQCTIGDIAKGRTWKWLAEAHDVELD